MAARRGRQAVADLRAAVIWLALEADPPDCEPVEQARDAVEAERLLLAVCRGRSKEALHCPDVALEGEIVGPRIVRSRSSSNGTFGLCGINRVQLQAPCVNVGQGRSVERPP